jgi:ABC-type uncharacterized transport system substrate-binding protein
VTSQALRFEIVAQDGEARAGFLRTRRGVIETPVFMPVGTAGTVKAVRFEELESADLDAKIILGNTYHLWLRPGIETIKACGGLHRFIGWNRALLTDSGGFQVWSLGNLRKISEEGTQFRSHVDGSLQFLSPEVSMQVQAALGSDIVMAFDDDPVGSGFVASLARPGGNITGLSTLSPEISGKQLELLKEVIPRLGRVAVIGTGTRQGTAQALKEMELAAGAFGVKLLYLDIQNPKDIESVFRAASKGRAEAVLVLQSPILVSQRTQIAALALKNRFPAISPRREFVEDGGLMSYGVSISDLDRRAATYVDKILKGVKPADLPVEQPTKFEFIVNLKTAKQIGLTIPPNVLARADRVIR